jgi:UDP-2,3-diacylglucosamine pyrophosphatase LpxH
LGSDYFHDAEFLAWLEALPTGAQLILNGDIIDDPRYPLSSAHQAVLQRLVDESHRRPIVWVYGNHDASFTLENPGQIQFVQHWHIDKRLLIMHGDDFDNVMPKYRLFKEVFRKLHDLLKLLGFANVHVARYAKKWGFLYRVFSNHVAHNALRAARSQGFAAVTCGHTHAAMVVEREGMSYFNTGAWTEKPLHYISIDADDIALHIYENGEV